MTTEKLTLVVSLADERGDVASVQQNVDGEWMVKMEAPVPRADLTRMLMAAGALVPMLPATDDAATHASMTELERWHNEDVASLCALRKEVETLGGRLKGTETACEVLRSERDELRQEVTDLKGALDMERAGAASLLREAGAQPGETLREVVLRLKQACDVATAQNERLRDDVVLWQRTCLTREAERDVVRAEVETLRRNLADAQSDNANNADEVMRLKAEVACRAGEVLKLSDALNEEHDRRRDAEVTIARFQSRCTLTLFTILAGMQRDNPLEGNVLDWEWENGVGRVVLCRRK